MALPDQIASASIAELFKRCVVSFRLLGPIIVERGHMNMALVGDDYGRLNIWGEQSGANRSGRGSLDDELRHNADVQALVKSILLRLDAVLRQALSLAEDDGPEGLQSISSKESAESESRSRVPRIAVLLRHATEQIKSLPELLSILRRPTVEGQWIRPATGPLLNELLDSRHVEERMHYWQERGNRHATVAERAAQGSAEAKAPWLMHRLVQANSKRRAQLQYWTDHPYELVESHEANPGIEMTQDEPRNETISPPETTDSEPPVEEPIPASDASDGATEAGPQTVYAPSDGSKRDRVPDAPKGNKHSQACPYCGMGLPPEVVERRDFWKRHIFRDLMPYICTFQDCQTPGKLYASRTDWIHHEMQMHRRRFVCQDCGSRSTDRQAMSEHLAMAHGDLLTTAQISLAVDPCNRRLDETSEQTCIMCAEVMPLSSLLAHLADHMEELALHVLSAGNERMDPDAPKHVAVEERQPHGLETGKLEKELAQSLQLVPDEPSSSKVTRWIGATRTDKLLDKEIDSGVEKMGEGKQGTAELLDSAFTRHLETAEGKMPRRKTLFTDEQDIPIFDSPPSSVGTIEFDTADIERFGIPEGAEEGVWGYLLPLYSTGSKPQTVTLRWRGTKDQSTGASSKGAERPEPSYPRAGLPQGGCLIGRHPECDIVIDNLTISNRHCLVYTKSKDNQMVAVVMDMSTNGTFVNDAILGRNQQRDLEDRDEISITGDHRLVFRYPETIQIERGAFAQRYTILDMLGKGHFAQVHRCLEKATGEVYAVKVFKTDDRTRMDELNAEMAILNSLNHPNVQHTKASFVEERAVYLVMEMAEQGELFNHVVVNTMLSEVETRKLFKQIFSGVEYLHDRNIAHRDIKPENIMIGDADLSRIWIVDFGLAKVTGEEDLMTTLCGTSSYVAPEILGPKGRREYDKAVDIWSLGVVLYVCLCGFPPFSDELYSDDFPYTLSQQIRSGRFDYPSPYWDSVGDPAIDLIDSMLVVNPRKRFDIKQCLSHPWTTEGEAEVQTKVRAPVRERTLLGSLVDRGRLMSSSSEEPPRRLPVRSKLADVANGTSEQSGK